MEDSNGDLVVYRLSWIAGIAGIGLALARAERLLRSSVEGLPWEVIIATAAVLGAAITWSGLAYRLRGRTVAAINIVVAVLAMVRIAVPSTTWLVFPTVHSLAAMRDELTFARDVIGTGVAPVIPLSGIIAILALVFWGLGALLAWGLASARPYVAVLAPLVVYLEFAVMDRRPGGLWTTVFMVFIGGALLAVAFDRRHEGTGHLTSRATRLALVRSLPSVSAVTLTAALFVAVVAATAFAGLVPHSGYLDWRARSGLSGEYYGSVSYNPFVGIRQSLISQTNVPVFVASVDGDLPAEQVYWRMLTLDTFDGSQWHVGTESEIIRPDDAARFEEPDSAFFGPTDSITQQITVLALQMDWLPAAYAPSAMTAPNTAVDRGFRVKLDDAALRFDALTYRGMSYTVESNVPAPDLDVLSRTESGAPSVVFAGAIEDNGFALQDKTLDLEPHALVDAEKYLDLPLEIDGRIRVLAVDTTRGLETDFEKGIALESFFRTPGNFLYSTAIVPGHSADDLAAWLVDPTSENYRTGYCEQFATSMAVMARMLEIPSRVVLGFTPGTVLEDGRVVVRDRNAHSWVELWMPTQGWVRFDPTPRGDGINPATLGDLPFDVTTYLDIREPATLPQDTQNSPGVLFRDEPLLDIPERIAATDSSTGAGTGLHVPGWTLPAALIAFALFGLIPAVKWGRRRRRLRRLETGDIAAAWHEILDRLTDLGDGPSPATTPLEFASRTDPVMRPLAEAYGASVYGPAGGDSVRVGVAERALEGAEATLAGRYPLGQRLRARYRVGTLLPQWMKRSRNPKPLETTRT